MENTFDQLKEILSPWEFGLMKQYLRVLGPWMFIDDEARPIWKGELQKRFPQEEFVPFAQRGDDEFLACFKSKEDLNVIVLYDMFSGVKSIIRNHDSFEEWFHQAIHDSIEFIKEDFA
jgi:hypothetical protein